MSDIKNLIRSTPPFRYKIGNISDGQLQTIENLIDDVYILTLRLAQLRYNERVRTNNKQWWDDLGVFLGVRPSPNDCVERSG